MNKEIEFFFLGLKELMFAEFKLEELRVDLA